MTDTQPTPPPQRETDRWLEPGKTNIQVIYVLYLASMVVGITSIIGVIIAYMNRGKAGGWIESHYTWAIRTFWMGILYSLIAAVLMIVGIGFLLIIAVAIWAIIRIVKGLQKAARDEAIDDPETWLI
ncbi:MAG: DUF4870 domain-containing protein [Brucellaceae bacterium]|nr:DUF4870 domain-containing protein [Brucellaceae bacterium]